MFRALKTGLLVPAVVATLVWAAGPALARGPGGGGHGGGFHGGGGGYHGGGHATAFRGGGYGGHYGGYGGWGRGYGGYGGYGWGHRGWGYGGWGGYGLGLYGGYPYSYGGYGGYPSYYGGYGGYPSYYGGYGAYPYYYGNSFSGSYYTPSYSYSTPYSSYLEVQPYGTNPDDSGYMGPSSTATTTDTLAHLKVEVPADAQIWIEGVKTKETGTVRDFVSPPLTPGQDYTYDIRATWTDEAGHAVDQTKHVLVHAGSQILVNFLAPAATE
jgi:uncharacterized protein (TIGR03000 family)